MIRFVELGLGTLLAAMIIVIGMHVVNPSFKFVNIFFGGVEETSSTAYDMDFNELIYYEDPVPVTTIYDVLSAHSEKIQSITLSYYKKGTGNTLVKTSPTKYSFKAGGVTSEGTQLNADDYRTYVISQLRYLFAEKAKISASEDKHTGLFDITIDQVERSTPSTFVEH